MLLATLGEDKTDGKTFSLGGIKEMAKPFAAKRQAEGAGLGESRRSELGFDARLDAVCKFGGSREWAAHGESASSRQLWGLSPED